jgi:hypothetical protein
MISPSNPTWLATYIPNLSKAITKGGATIDFTQGLVIPENFSDDNYVEIISSLSGVQSKNRAVASAIDRFIGQAILDWVAAHTSTIDEAITQLDLERITGKAAKTLAKLPRMVAVLPNEAFTLPNLSTVHWETATSFGGPKDNLENLQAFNADRLALLERVSENPSVWTRSILKSHMRDLQAKYSIVSNRKRPISEVADQYNVASAMLIDLTDEELEEHHQTTRVALTDRWRDLREQLVDAGKVPGSLVDGYMPPWSNVTRPIEAAIEVAAEATVVEPDVIPEDGEDGDD